MAVINIGSGSVKLYLEKARQTEAKATLLALYANNNDKTALDDTFNAVAFFYHKAKSLGESVCIFGTESMRRAGYALTQRIFDELGLSVEIISGETEALCGFLGCISDGTNDDSAKKLADIGKDKTNADKIGGNTKMLVIDVGGASTEISLGADKPDFCVSLPIGSVVLFDRFGVINENSPDIFLLGLYNYIDSVLIDLHTKNLSQTGKIKLIGGGAINLAAILLNQQKFDAGALDQNEIPLDSLPPLIAGLFTMTVKERTQKHPFLEEKRALVLPYGISIIYRLLNLLPRQKAVVNRSGLIEGYLRLKNKKVMP